MADAQSDAVASAYRPGPGTLSENIPKFWNEWSPVARAYLRKSGGDDGRELLRLLMEAETTQDTIPMLPMTVTAMPRRSRTSRAKRRDRERV
jgi:hypothetical protein